MQMVLLPIQRPMNATGTVFSLALHSLVEEVRRWMQDTAPGVLSRKDSAAADTFGVSQAY